MDKPSICVLGLGYIGLPTAALLASRGYSVFGVDVSPKVVNTINSGLIHIVEPELDEIVRSTVANGKLHAYLTPHRADIYMICVPTPFKEGPGIPQPDTDFVMAATRSIASFVKPGDMVILESTSPVGTTREMADVLQEDGIDIDLIHFAYCPERVLPGKIMAELIENDRVVGGLTADATKKVSNFYRSFVKGEVLETDAATAEMCKLTENSFRDVNIAFANELSLLCANAGVDVWELINLANKHPRVNILYPGVGVGGHCIAVDPWFIVAKDPQNAILIRTAREINIKKTTWVIDQIKIAVADAMIGIGRIPKVACLGLAFKPDIDDLRESPALQIAFSLQAQGYDVVAVEPNIQEHESLPLWDLSDAIEHADVLVLLVKHKAFLDLKVKAVLQQRNALDYCGATF